jgi:acyl dehydratase
VTVLSFEDLPLGEPSTFGSYRLERDEIVSFAAKWDPQPFHLDDEAAKASLFGALSASGWHTCAMAMRMMCDAYLLESASLGSPGLEKLSWTKPVYPGDTLHVRLEVLESRALASRPGVGLIRSRWNVMNQDDETVLLMEGYGMFRRRGPAAP